MDRSSTAEAAVIFRYRYQQAGGHVHVRVFQSKDGHNFEKNGDLVFDERSWRVFWLAMESLNDAPGIPHVEGVRIEIKEENEA